jgi:hypothetical protein
MSQIQKELSTPVIHTFLKCDYPDCVEVRNIGPTPEYAIGEPPTGWVTFWLRKLHQLSGKRDFVHEIHLCPNHAQKNAVISVVL